MQLMTLRAAALALAAAMVAPAAGATASRTDAWVLVQLADRVTPGQRLALERTGLESFQYTPENAYVAFGSAEEAERARRVDGVRGVRPLRRDEKVDPAARRGSGELMVEVLTAQGRSASVASRMNALGELVHSTTPDDALVSLVGMTPASAVEAIADEPAVLWVAPAATGLYPEDEGTAQIIAGNIENGAPVTGYEAWLQARGINGDGVTITIADTGMDEEHPELAGRIVQSFFEEEGDRGGHGTHVSGIVGGLGASFGANPVRARDQGLFLLGHGVAPKVKFVDQAVLGNAAPPFPPTDFTSYTTDSVRAGSIGWNASWNTGGAANGGYVSLARNLDFRVRDADPATPGDQAFTMVFSAGNAAGTAKTITQPKEAKNLITVGSSRSHRVLATTSPIDSISSFSSKGPARDNRILPTVAAPGEEVISSRARMSTGSCTLPLSFAGVQGYAGGAAHYTGCSGTSMAAPHVTGSVVLIHDWWRERNGGDDPSPAMAKALLINSATDMATADIPNGSEGWGRVNLGALFDPAANRIYLDQTVVFDDLADVHAVQVEPVDPAKPLKVSLVWTDAPGKVTTGKALVNDLDLTLTAPDGTLYRGNVFAGGRSIPGGSLDRLNNLENVFLHTPGSGTFTVTIAPFNLPGDGIPSNPALTDQDFALVVTNARVVA